MISDGGGSIINLSSVQACQAAIRACSYPTSKARSELDARDGAHPAATDIRVNCIAPGTVYTPMVHRAA
jgi:NAD(P)-dependent dehydrogenase (short-subunit alcohol dehydrogenase family)